MLFALYHSIIICSIVIEPHSLSVQTDANTNTGVGQQIRFCMAHNGTTYNQGVIFSYRENNAGSNSAALCFASSNDGTPVEAMRINSIQQVGIGCFPSYQFQVSSDSAAKPSSNTWTVYSDERLKNNIELADISLCYQNVKNLPLKRYTWKDEIYTVAQVPDRSKIGWVAQDVQKIFEKSITATDSYDISGCLSLNADQIYASMYGAIQLLMSKVEILEMKINTLLGQ